MEFSNNNNFRIQFSISNFSLLSVFFAFLAGSFAHSSELASCGFYAEAVPFSDQNLAHVTSDGMKGYGDIKATLDQDGNLQLLRYETDKGLKTEIPLNQLPQGVSLKDLEGHTIAKLASQNMNPGSGGDIQLSYLADGMSGTYEVFPIELVRKGNFWVLQTNDQSGHKEFTSIFLKAKCSLE